MYWGVGGKTRAHTSGSLEGDRMWKTQPCALWGHHSASAGSLSRESRVQSARSPRTSYGMVPASSEPFPGPLVLALTHFSTSKSPVPLQPCSQPLHSYLRIPVLDVGSSFLCPILEPGSATAALAFKIYSAFLPTSSWTAQPSLILLSLLINSCTHLTPGVPAPRPSQVPAPPPNPGAYNTHHIPP